MVAARRRQVDLAVWHLARVRRRLRVRLGLRRSRRLRLRVREGEGRGSILPRPTVSIRQVSMRSVACSVTLSSLGELRTW